MNNWIPTTDMNSGIANLPVSSQHVYAHAIGTGSSKLAKMLAKGVEKSPPFSQQGHQNGKSNCGPTDEKPIV